MITNARKEKVSKANKHVLEVIWRLGKGLMYKKHIEAYMEHFFNQKPEVTWKKLKELEESDVVERVRLYNIVVIKLKKYALRFLLGVEREQIRSIDVTASKLMRSAYVHALILEHLKEVRLMTFVDYKMFLDRYCPLSTFFIPRNTGYEVMERYAKKGVFSNQIDKEIDRLREIKVKSLFTEDKAKEEKEVDYKFTINSMEQASIYIDYTTRNSLTGISTIRIAIIDDKNNLRGSKIAEKIMRTYSYFYEFVPFGTLFKFTVYVRNGERLEALEDKANTKAFNDYIATKSKIQGFIWNSGLCEVNYVNLDLDKKLFGNQSLILSGSVNSKKLC